MIYTQFVCWPRSASTTAYKVHSLVLMLARGLATIAGAVAGAHA